MSDFTPCNGKYYLCKILVSNNEYSKFLGISGQMLGSTKVYNNILFEIYLYIFIAHANYKLGNKVKAIKFLRSSRYS